ncbi:hypothetical protein WJX81_001189 [Elliptochloris bilobata]|uniref:Major facilitator superfamily (MFS) profile domain-containing protein n=1 Tax=Elliptochloris bilobata TaxID=381761 RepID=A0AAW1QCX3_9CHLO
MRCTGPRLQRSSQTCVLHTPRPVLALTGGLLLGRHSCLLPEARRPRHRQLATGRNQCKAYDSAAHASDFGRSLPRPTALDTHQRSAKDVVGRALVQVARYLKENEYLLVVAASTMIMSLSHTALRPVLPVFAKGFGVGAAAVGSTISVYAVARLMMNLPAGVLADRYGRKPLLVWGPAVTALGMVGCGMSATFGQLLLWRWVTGVGSALQMAGAQLFLTDISVSGNRARTLGTNQAASLVGGLVGPAVGGLLADVSGLRAPFTMTGIAAAAAAVYGLLRLPETRRLSEEREERARVAEEADECEAEQPAASQPSASRAAGPAPGARVLAAAVENGSAAAAPSGGKAKKRRWRRPGWLQLLTSRDFGAISLVNGIMFMTANGSRSVLVPLHGVQAFGLTTTVMGLLFAGMAVVSLVGVMPAAWVADHLGRKWTIVPSCLGLAAALLLMAATRRTEFFFAAMVMYAAANACIGATPAAYAADVMPSAVSGFGLGIYRCAGDIGLMVGPALLGWIADLTSVQTALAANAAVLVAATAYFGLAARETRHLRTRIEDTSTWLTPSRYLLLFVFVTSAGGFLFGYDTGVIAGALPYLRDTLLLGYEGDVARLNAVQEIIVSSAVAGAAAGAAVGGAASDRLGRKPVLLAADVLFALGAALMAAAPGLPMLIAGRVASGLGIGLASMVVPVYIAEASPRRSRAALVTANTLMITGGQFVAYVADFGFTYVPGTWRWMLGAAALPAVAQAAGLLWLPESPRWLAGQGDQQGAQRAMRALAEPREAARELAEMAEQARCCRGADAPTLRQLLRAPALRRQLGLGVGLQVLQQFAAINTVMYYTPTILELAGVHGRRKQLLVALAPAAVNALGTVAGMLAIERCGRRRLLLGSLAGVVVALAALGSAFRAAEASTLPVTLPGSCPAAGVSSCSACLAAGCGFCAQGGGGACTVKGGPCMEGAYSDMGCPSAYTPLIIACVLAYLAAFSPGLGPVPWAFNSEIYPLQVRALANGVAVTANWAANALVANTFLSLAHALGGSGVFWLYAAVATCGAVWVLFALPETAGLGLDEVQALFVDRGAALSAARQQSVERPV